MPEESPETDEDRIGWREVPLFILAALPVVAIGLGAVAMGAYLPLETRMRMVEKMGIERALFWQGAGWTLVLWVWWRLFIKAEIFMSGAFPSAPAAMISLGVASFFFGWLVFVAGTLCGTVAW